MLAPMALAISLLNECCLAEQQRKDRTTLSARTRAPAGRRGSASIFVDATGLASLASSARVLIGALPCVGWLLRPNSPLAGAGDSVGANYAAQPATAQRAGGAPVAVAPRAGAIVRDPPAAVAPPAAGGTSGAAHCAHGRWRAEEGNKPQRQAADDGAFEPSAPPPAYTAQAASSCAPQPQPQPQRTGADGAPAGAGDEESTAALVGKLATRAAKGIAAGAAVGLSVAASAVSSAVAARAPPAAGAVGTTGGGS